ncbi:MAG: DNA primase [Alphaproteobacteria bacterium]|nr:DNA primase [Alphaproteobacteria bacterium]
MLFSSTFLDGIRHTVPLADVISPFVTWDRRKSARSSGYHWACCPFHNEKTPSFRVDSQKGYYYCFGCKASGDIFSFLQEKEGLSFPEVVERLAVLGGISMPISESQVKSFEPNYKHLLSVMTLATRYFEEQLRDRRGAKAQKYLTDLRGVSFSAIEQFRLGYAPDGYAGLKDYLTSCGVPIRDMIDAGLVVTRDTSSSYDYFRDRVMFPITDLQERVVAFGGRALSSDAKAKYLNSPETPLFRKGRLLYHAAPARRGARRAGSLIVVEGYMDVIALVQAGIDSVVSPLGTALTREQLSCLWSMSDEPVMCFDGDPAGEKAAHRVMDLALPFLIPGKSLRFALLSCGQDPYDLVQEKGENGVKEAVLNAVPLVDMLWNREFGLTNPSTPERRALFVRHLRDLTQTIKDTEVRQLYKAEFETRRESERAASPLAPRLWTGASGRHFSSSLRVVPKKEALDSLAREGVFIMIALNYPGILCEEIEIFGRLELTIQRLNDLLCAILDLAVMEKVTNSEVLWDRLELKGFGKLLQRVDRVVRQVPYRFALSGCERDEVVRGLKDTLSLHRRFILNQEVQAAQEAGDVDRLVHLKKEVFREEEKVT